MSVSGIGGAGGVDRVMQLQLGPPGHLFDQLVVDEQFTARTDVDRIHGEYRAGQ